MQQAKISAFFKPSALRAGDPPPLEAGGKDLGISVTYKRRDLKSNPPISDDEEFQLDDEEMEERLATPRSRSDSGDKILKKKRSYTQYHLDFGQSDFVLHACPVCGIMYACGDEGDEKVHKIYHKNYCQGIQFKGWHVERVLSTTTSRGNGDRIVLVLDSDPTAQKQKVQRVVKMMDRELGLSDGELLHKLCKAYLFISSHRIVGCLVAEPISTARKVISNTGNSVSKQLEVRNAETGTSLQFGNIKFKREIIKKGCSKTLELDHWEKGAVFCEETTLPATCGIRAIWVVPAHRRKQIASQLLDTARKSFRDGPMLDLSECAISSPTSAGSAFFSSYTRSKTFLVYKADIV